MDRFLEIKGPKCGKVMTRHFCHGDPPCDVKYYCSEHRGGCGHVIKKRKSIRRRNWNPYNEEAHDKRNP